MPALHRESYSSKTFARLEVAGLSLPVARISRNSLILRETADVPPCDAKIVVNVDGVETAYPIHLFQGIGAQSMVVEFL